jgi:hypothetical protein
VRIRRAIAEFEQGAKKPLPSPPRKEVVQLLSITRLKT